MGDGADDVRRMEEYAKAGMEEELLQEELNREEKYEPDHPDEQYELAREREGDQLDAALKKLYQNFVVDGVGGINYYKGCKQKFFDHAVSNLKHICRV